MTWRLKLLVSDRMRQQPEHDSLGDDFLGSVKGSRNNGSTKSWWSNICVSVVQILAGES